MNPVSAILSSGKRALKGKEKLWIVFWLWGVALYAMSLVIGYVVMRLSAVVGPFVTSTTGILGAVFVLVYPFLYCWSLWRCAATASYTWLRVGARLYAVALFPFIHVGVGVLVLFASHTLVFRQNMLLNTPAHLVPRVDEPDTADVPPAIAGYYKMAMEGRTDAHLNLARIYCGEICFVPRPDADERAKSQLARSFAEVQALNVQSDYVKAYMHYMLAEDFKASYTGSLEMLSQHMLEAEVEMARRAAKEWRERYYRTAQ